MEGIKAKNQIWVELGGSIPVENVQQLASANLQDIPDRYIRPESVLEEVSSDESLQIPVIDMAKLASDHSSYELEMAKLHSACEDWGFFQLTNHGAKASIEKMKVVTEQFFDLSLEVKMAYSQKQNDVEGYGQAFVLSEDQKLDWGDMLFLLALPMSVRNMSFWPNTPTSFRPTFEEYSSDLQKISMNLIKSMAANLGVDADELSGMFRDGTQGIRMNYYPPCVEADKVYGLTPHSDATGLTLLVQVNEVEGLQIRKNEKWLKVEPIPEAIIVNIGDIIEIMSNGNYTSIEHRAVVNFERERISIAAFHGPNITTKVRPLQDLVKENGAKYKTIEYKEYMKLRMMQKLDGKSSLDQFRVKQ